MSNKCSKSSSKKKHNDWWKWFLCGFVSFVVGVIVDCISLFLGYNNILFHDDNAFSDGVVVSKVKIILKEVLTFFNFHGII